MQKANEYKYLKFITYLQIIGIILVVLGHSLVLHPDGVDGQYQWYIRMLGNVRMPLFTFVSGFLMYYTSFALGRKTRTWKSFLKNKVKRLLLPYFTLLLVTFVPRAAMSSLAEEPVELSFAALGRSLVVPEELIIPFFWFIQMSFILLVMTYGVLVLCRRFKIPQNVAILSLLVIFALLLLSELQFPTNIFSINRVLRLGVYFVLGIVYCHYGPWFDRHLHLFSIFTAILSGAAWVIMYYYFEGDPINYLLSMVGITAFVSLCHIMEERNIRILDHLQGANYIIFLLSWYINIATQQVLSHFVTLPWWFHTILSLVGGIYIPWLGLRYLERHSDSRWVRVTAFLLGQKLKKPKPTLQGLHEASK